LSVTLIPWERLAPAHPLHPFSSLCAFLLILLSLFNNVPEYTRSARNGAAAGVIPTSSPSAVRSARSWFPKRSTISVDSGWYYRCKRTRKEQKKGWRCISRFPCRRHSYMSGETDCESVRT